jgi:hypothetical protein
MTPNPLRRVIRSVGERDPLLLAHHPSCEYYSHHTFELYDRQVCMGCFIVYPVGFASLLSLAVGRLVAPGLPVYGFETLTLYAVGAALLMPMVLSKAMPGSRSSRSRVVGKALLAVGLAVVAFPFLFRPAARLSTALIFFGFLVPYVAYKGVTARDDCEGCPEADDFPNCSGMTFDGDYAYPEGSTGR